jgi:hypothetical protein
MISGGEEAVISGMKLTVDGVAYTSGTVLIRPESQVTLTVLEENLHNISSKNNNNNTTIDFLNGMWVLSADGTEFSYTSDSSAYSNFNPARELRYCNDSAVGDDIGSGIFVYYGTQMPAQITGVSITVDGETYTELPMDSIVSMNLWGFRREALDCFEDKFRDFLTNTLPSNPEKAEFFLPLIVSDMITRKTGTIKVLSSAAHWHGVTYKEDLPSVVDAVQAMKDAGKYPEYLWR